MKIKRKNKFIGCSFIYLNRKEIDDDDENDDLIEIASMFKMLLSTKNRQLNNKKIPGNLLHTKQK